MIFALGGTIGPLLIFVLFAIEFKSALYHSLYTLIAVLCPAWVLGVLEYSYSRAATWFVILGANVVVWTLLGVVVAIGQRAKNGTAGIVVVIAIACPYAYWLVQSSLAVLILGLILTLAFIASGGKHGAAIA